METPEPKESNRGRAVAFWLLLCGDAQAQHQAYFEMPQDPRRLFLPPRSCSKKVVYPPRDSCFVRADWVSTHHGESQGAPAVFLKLHSLGEEGTDRRGCLE